MDATLGQTIGFCAANQVVMELTYNGSVRNVEVYSYRANEKTNEQLLLCFEYEAGHTKSYKVDNIEHAKATVNKFVPRWPIEIAGEPVQ